MLICLTVALALACSLAAAVLTLRQPARYRAACLLDCGTEPVALTMGPAAQAAGPSKEEWYRTQDCLLTSDVVLDRVVQALNLSRDRAFLMPAPEQRGLSGRAAAVANLRECLTVSKVEGTHMVRITVGDADAERAARIANTLAETYLRKSLEDRTIAAQRAVQWLGEQVEATSNRLTGAEGELQTFSERPEAAASGAIAARPTRLNVAQDTIVGLRLWTKAVVSTWYRRGEHDE